MKRILLADMDAVVLSAAGLLVAAGILLHLWGRSSGKSARPRRPLDDDWLRWIP